MHAPIRTGGWTIRASPRATTVARDRETVATFDLEGRPVSWFRDGRAFKRSLASEVHVRFRVGGRRQRAVLPPREALESFEFLRELVSAIPGSGLGDDVVARIDAILGWTPSALAGERRRFDAVYRPVTILPPDQYLSIVLQATHGCSWNRCTFCNFYQDRPFEARDTDSFAAHVADVRTFLGRGATLRRGVFLADGNALVLSDERLHPLLRIARDAFPGRPIDGFVDVLTGVRRPASAWAALRDLGVRRVHVGLETAHDPLLRWLGKPGDASDAREAIDAMKKGGLSVSLILMCGAGGDRFEAGHVEESIAMVVNLDLDVGDVVYLSPFRLHDGSEYARRAVADGVRELGDSELEAQYRTLRDEIRARNPALQVARYDIEEFLY